jgi:uncharacterized phiE125 gp8 family phage protein
VSLAEVKLQCRIDADIVDNDSQLLIYQQAAREQAEEFTRRAFMPQSWRYTLPCFPIIEKWWTDQRIRLPRCPVISIDKFTYIAWDDVGTATPLTPWDGTTIGQAISNQYLLATDDEPPTLEPPFGSFWPICRPQAGAVVVEFTAGYEGVGSPTDFTDTSGVPARAKQAILSLCGHWNENREAVVAGPRYSAEKVPFATFEDTLDTLRVYP